MLFMIILSCNHPTSIDVNLQFMKSIQKGKSMLPCYERKKFINFTIQVIWPFYES